MNGILACQTPGTIKSRNCAGSNIVEFSVCLVVILAVIVMPLVNYGTILTRWSIANQVVASWTNTLARQRTFSSAIASACDEGGLPEELRKTAGVDAVVIEPSLLVTKIGDPQLRKLEIYKPGELRDEWLPSTSGNAYSFRLRVEADLEPVVKLSFFELQIPGLTVPVRINLLSESNWENLGRNPSSREFFLNE